MDFVVFEEKIATIFQRLGYPLLEKRKVGELGETDYHAYHFQHHPFAGIAEGL